MPGGAVDPKEAVVDTMRREVWEEVRVTLDQSFPPLCVGGWNQPESRDRQVNDRYLCFAVRAATKEFAVDGEEIKRARWVDIEFLLDMLRSRHTREELQAPHLHEGTVKTVAPGGTRGWEVEGEKYSEVMIWFLHNYRQGKHLHLVRRRVMGYGVDRYYLL